MRKKIVAVLAGLAVAAGAALAQVPPGGGMDEDFVLGSEAFLAAHPDLANRTRGMEAYDAGEFGDALDWFRLAARYADKPSQAMVAEMLWKGEGGARDPALAYAWMDLAAERGYPGFTAVREHYWEQLDEAQRRQALARGQDVYAEYGDAVAQPRIAAVLRRERRRTTGSRTGFVGALRVVVPGPGGTTQEIDGSQFYDARFWDPVRYQAWHDSTWARPRIGRVTVGELEDADGSRIPPPDGDPQP